MNKHQRIWFEGITTRFEDIERRLSKLEAKG